jgi:hypothetical protein
MTPWADMLERYKRGEGSVTCLALMDLTFAIRYGLDPRDRTIELTEEEIILSREALGDHLMITVESDLSKRFWHRWTDPVWWRLASLRSAMRRAFPSETCISPALVRPTFERLYPKIPWVWDLTKVSLA